MGHIEILDSGMCDDVHWNLIKVTKPDAMWWICHQPDSQQEHTGIHEMIWVTDHLLTLTQLKWG